MPEPVILPMRGLAAIRQANMNPLGQVLPQRGDPLQKKRDLPAKGKSLFFVKSSLPAGYGPSDGNQDAQVVPQFPPSAAASLVRPRRLIMAMSSTMVEPDVVSILPVIDAEAPHRRAVAPFSGRSLRPAARRILASGLMKRKKAMVRRMSSPESSPVLKRRAGNGHQGVDGNGFKCRVRQG